MDKIRVWIIILGMGLPFANAQDRISGNATYLDLVYKIESQDTLKLDLFLPDERFGKQFPLLIIIHGGAWVAGDKGLESNYYMRQMKRRLLASGIAVASIDYRLLSKTMHFPAPIQDGKDAVNWLFEHAEQYRIDTNNVGLWGGSAGGHLAMLIAYADPQEFAEAQHPREKVFPIRYVVNNFGPTDLNSLFKIEMGRMGVLFFKLFINKLYVAREQLTYALTGLHLQAELEALKQANTRYSPLNYIDESTAPTLIFHGTKDRIVPFSQSEELKSRLDAQGVQNELIPISGGDHGFNNITENRLDHIVEQTIDFIFRQKRHYPSP